MPLALLLTGTFAVTLALNAGRHGNAVEVMTPSTPSSVQSLTTPALRPRVALNTVNPHASSERRSRLDAEPFNALVAAGIGADDSEQRTLAIRELAKAPPDQAFDGLARILLENADRRSRLDALDELMALPGSELDAGREALIARLTQDADPAVASAAAARVSRSVQLP